MVGEIHHEKTLAALPDLQALRLQVCLLRFNTTWVLGIQLAAGLERPPVRRGIRASFREIFGRSVRGNPRENSRRQWAANVRAVRAGDVLTDQVRGDHLASRH